MFTFGTICPNTNLRELAPLGVPIPSFCFCEQFAGAYAVMARAIGLPTRVAVGFTTGEDAGGGQYEVRDANAHAWPEVYFTSLGWLPFEAGNQKITPVLQK